MQTGPTRAIGLRIAQARRDAGFRTVEQLVETIGNPAVTVSGVQNVESGRKADVSVTYLLEIARAVGVPPVMLLVDVDHPFEPVEGLPLGEQFDGLRVWQFDDWFSGVGNPTTADVGGVAALDKRVLLERVRQMVDELNEWHRTAANIAGGRGGDDLQFAQEQRQERIDRLVGMLANRGRDTSWVRRPWRQGD